MGPTSLLASLRARRSFRGGERRSRSPIFGWVSADDGAIRGWKPDQFSLPKADMAPSARIFEAISQLPRFQVAWSPPPPFGTFSVNRLFQPLRVDSSNVVDLTESLSS